MSDGVRLRVVSYTAQCVRVVCSVSVLFVCTFFASEALHEVSPHWPVPARTVTTSHRMHTGMEVGEVVDKFEADTTRACCLSCVTVLVRALRVSDAHERQRTSAWYTAQRVCGVCLVSVLFVCTLFASEALHEVSPHWPVPARTVTTSHRMHTGMEVGEVVDKFEADTTRACCLSCVTVLVRALRVSDAHERQRTFAWYTAQRVCGVCLVSVVSVCTLFASGALHEVSPHWPLPARFRKGETSVRGPTGRRITGPPERRLTSLPGLPSLKELARQGKILSPAAAVVETDSSTYKQIFPLPQQWALGRHNVLRATVRLCRTETTSQRQALG